jgi:xylulose-5-phosphate/fructose-6-phosphate phosphoketolase
MTRKSQEPPRPGYKQGGTTTTSFDMVVLNDLDRFHLIGDVIDRVPSLDSRTAYAKQFLRDKVPDHKQYIQKHGQDIPEIRNWKCGRGKTQKKKPLEQKMG